MNNCLNTNACSPVMREIEAFQSWSEVDDLNRSRLRRSISFEHIEQEILDSCSEVHAEGPSSWDMCSSVYNTPVENNMRDNFQALSIRNNLPDTENTQGKIDEKSNFKTKLLASWNNLRHGFTLKLKTQFSYDHPIILLGNFYHRKSSSVTPVPHDFRRTLIPENKLGMEEFKRDIFSRICFTYRRNMHPLPNTDDLRTDLGWGCMLRVGQMMLGFAISQHLLNRAWRLQENSCELSTHRSIIELFNDHSEPLGPLSIHKMIEISKNYGKKAKDWFGPATMACIIKDCIEDLNLNNTRRKTALDYSLRNPLSRFTIYIAENCTVYMKDVENLALDNAGNWKTVLILIPVRLGGEKLNKDYAECLKGILSFDGCAGVLGGKPRHSVWVCGSQEDEFIYLDPHLCQESVNLRDEATEIQTFHCLEPRKMSFGKLDPSCTVCFICKSRKQLEELRENIQRYCITKERRNDSSPPMRYPVFSMVDKESQPAEAIYSERTSRDKQFEDFVLL